MAVFGTTLTDLQQGKVAEMEAKNRAQEAYRNFLGSIAQLGPIREQNQIKQNELNAKVQQEMRNYGLALRQQAESELAGKHSREIDKERLKIEQGELDVQRMRAKTEQVAALVAAAAQRLQAGPAQASIQSLGAQATAISKQWSEVRAQYDKTQKKVDAYNAELGWRRVILADGTYKWERERNIGPKPEGGVSGRIGSEWKSGPLTWDRWSEGKDPADIASEDELISWDPVNKRLENVAPDGEELRQLRDKTIEKIDTILRPESLDIWAGIDALESGKPLSEAVRAMGGGPGINGSNRPAPGVNPNQAPSPAPGLPGGGQDVLEILGPDVPKDWTPPGLSGVSGMQQGQSAPAGLPTYGPEYMEYLGPSQPSTNVVALRGQQSPIGPVEPSWLQQQRLVQQEQLGQLPGSYSYDPYHGAAPIPNGATNYGIVAQPQGGPLSNAFRTRSGNVVIQLQ